MSSSSSNTNPNLVPVVEPVLWRTTFEVNGRPVTIEDTYFLNSEQRIIYEEKTVNNFLNNAEQKIILCRILEIVYVENSEQFS